MSVLVLVFDQRMKRASLGHFGETCYLANSVNATTSLCSKAHHVKAPVAFGFCQCNFPAHEASGRGAETLGGCGQGSFSWPPCFLQVLGIRCDRELAPVVSAEEPFFSKAPSSKPDRHC